jgi:peroxiredoxin
MATTDTVPDSIATWIAARTDPAQVHRLRESFAENVEFTFAGRHRSGIDAVVAHLQASPSSALGTAEWRLIPDGDDRFVVRFTGHGGAPMPSPGGPMAAMDFVLTLDAAGKIVALSPRPHHTEPADLAAPLAPGSPMPEFSLPDFTGRLVAWRDPQARAHVLLWTSNHCPWALGWHDRIQAVARDYADKDVRVVQINGNDPAISPADAPARSQERVEAGEFAGPYLQDPGQEIARQVGARHTPDVFVLDAEGTVVYHGAPDADSERPDLRAEWIRAALDDVLAGRTVGRAQTEPIGCTIKWTL